MRDELASSLDYIGKELQTQYPDTAIAARAESLGRVSRFVHKGDARPAPAIFAAYYRLVDVLQSDVEQAADALDQLTAVAVPAAGPHPIVFESASFQAAGIPALYRDALNTDAGQAFTFSEPLVSAREQAMALVAETRALMARAVPELDAEFDALVAELVLAGGTTSDGARTFDGASSYQLWGALVLNVDEPRTMVGMLETLAHESAHSLLFGMTIDEPLVQNGGEAGFESPFRADRRPLEGIFHATWVAARMHYALTRLCDSTVVTDDQRAECITRLAASRRSFEQGDAVLLENARLSETGRTLLDQARGFM